MSLVNLSTYYTWKNIKSKYNKNVFKISAPTWNDNFDLPDGSYSISDIQDYFGFIIKKHETLTDNPPIQIYPNETLTEDPPIQIYPNETLTEDPPIQIYPNKIKNRIIFKIKTCCKVELLTPETMKLLVSTKKMLIQIKIAKMYQN